MITPSRSLARLISDYLNDNMDAVKSGKRFFHVVNTRVQFDLLLDETKSAVPIPLDQVTYLNDEVNTLLPEILFVNIFKFVPAQ